MKNDTTTRGEEGEEDLTSLFPVAPVTSSLFLSSPASQRSHRTSGALHPAQRAGIDSNAVFPRQPGENTAGIHASDLAPQSLVPNKPQ